MSFCLSATVAAPRAVIAPIHEITVPALPSTVSPCVSTAAMTVFSVAITLASSRNTCARHIRNTPAVTIVAAWISAETGVGPSMASGSHTWSGNCALFPIAPRKKSSAIAVTVPCDSGARRPASPE